MTAVSISSRRGSLDPPAGQAFRILHVGYVLLPLIAGADKFLGLLADWEAYLAPVVTDTVGMDAETIMRIVGGIELVAAVLVLIRPGIGGYVVAAWLAVIIVNLLVLGDFYDVALRDFGLLLGALALARLSAAAGRPSS
jgi:hypothetical protein